MQPFTIRAMDIEHAIIDAEYDVLLAKAAGFDRLRDHLRSLLRGAWEPAPRGGEASPEPANIKTDGAEPLPVQAPSTEPAPDADPFAPARPPEPQPQPRRGGRRSRRSEEGQPQQQDAQPTTEPQPAPEEGQPLTAEALGLTPEPAPAAQPLPLPVVEAPDVSTAPATADDVYGTEPAEDPFA
jgi:hypothetical protein